MSRLLSEMRKDLRAPSWPPLSPCHHRPTAPPGRPAPERSAHCIPVGFLQKPGCWSPAQSTLEPQSSQAMNQPFPLYPTGMFMFLQLPTHHEHNPPGQVNCSHVPSQVPLSCEELTPGPTTSQDVVATHPQGLEEYQPRPAAHSLRPWPFSLRDQHGSCRSKQCRWNHWWRREGGILFFFFF